jgi:hypothetical protein
VVEYQSTVFLSNEFEVHPFSFDRRDSTQSRVIFDDGYSLESAYLAEGLDVVLSRSCGGLTNDKIDYR